MSYFDSELILRCKGFEYRYERDFAKWPYGIINPQVSGIQIFNNKIYIANRSKEFPIAVFDMEGNFIKGFGRELNFGRIHGISICDREELYVCDDEKNYIYSMNLNGEDIYKMGGEDMRCQNGYDSSLPWPHDLYSITRAGEPFNRPTKVIKSKSGYIYVTDGYANVSVHKFTDNWELLETWGGPGRKLGEFRLPHSITEDAAGKLWITDRENFRLQVFNNKGKCIKSFEHLLYPSETWTDGEMIYLIEGYGRLSVYSLDMSKIAEIGYENSILEGGHSIGGDEQGNLYIGSISASSTFCKLTRLS